MNKNTALEKLAAALNRPVADFTALETLKAPQLQLLTEDFLAAQRRQRAGMQQAIDAALQHVPRLLRGTVIKILRG